MSNINVRSKFVSVLGAAGVLLGANSALAYSVSSQAFDGETWGNSRFNAKYGYQGSENSTGSVASSSVSRSSGASQTFYVHGTLFGKTSEAVDWWSGATGSVRRSGSNPEVYEDRVFIQAILNNDELFMLPLRDQPCPDHGAEWSCSTYEKSMSKTLFKKSADFSLAGIPITVDGSLVGNVTASAGAWGRAMPFVGRPDSLRSTALAELSVGAFLEGRLRAFAGIDNVLAVGVSAKLRFIEANVTSKSMSRQDGLGAGARILHTNVMPLTLKTMGGKVTLWADVTPLWTEEMTLINWKGYSWTGNILGFENVVEDV